MERFISLVKARPYLYDCTNDDFKNRDKKMEGWEDIAKEMGTQTGTYWRFKWNRLKENYSKYKKINGYQPNPIYRKYRNWPWSQHMKFTDSFPSRKSIKKENDCDKDFSEPIGDHSYVSEKNLNDIGNNANTKQSGYSEELAEYIDITRSDGDLIQNEIYLVEQSNEENDIPEENIKFIIHKDTPNSSRKRKMRSDNNQTSESSKNKKDKISDYDEAEHFFLSYAKTFKRLPTKLQRVLKLEMVTLFARYELMAERDETS